VSLDGIRQDLGISAKGSQGPVISEAREKCRVLLRKKTSFCFDATNITLRTRRKWVNLFMDYKAKVDIVYTDTTLKEVIQRNEKRVAGVPEKALKDLFWKLDPPDLTECYGMIMPNL